MNLKRIDLDQYAQRELSLPSLNMFSVLNIYRHHAEAKSGPEVIKLFSCSTQLSMNFQMQLSIKVSEIWLFLGSDKPRMLFFLLINNCWHFNIYELEKFHAELS